MSAPLTLAEKQRLLAKLLPRLLDKLHELGYEATLGDGFRDPRTHGHFGESMKCPTCDAVLGYGATNSCHKLRLAVDLNLFRGRTYLTRTEDHRELGEFWESLHPLCRWGGHFKAPDGNHYGIRHEGRA